MFVYIMIASGVCWIITYLLIIKQSFAQRTYGMPMAALCANISNTLFIYQLSMVFVRCCYFLPTTCPLEQRPPNLETYPVLPKFCGYFGVGFLFGAVYYPRV